MTVPIAFYAPLKSPNHPAPSGDRSMARLLLAALRAAGFAPRLASELRTLDKAGNPAVQDALRQASLAESDRLIDDFCALPMRSRPRLWFTYHVYYKAPDWIGPRVADALAIPYVVAEGSRAQKRAGGRWALGHRGAEAALDRAEAVFTLTEADREALEPRRPPRQAIIDLPPFLDLSAWPPLERGPAAPMPRLLTVAMMRAGDKLASYGILAGALRRVADRPWTLDIVGEGEASGEVEGLFADFGERVRRHGAIHDRASLARLYADADLLVWPAVNEAFGMALLEAQAQGCPVVAGAFGGVASVLRHGETGILTHPGDEAAFGAAVAALIGDAPRRRRFGIAARRFVRGERGLEGAAERLREALQPLLLEEALP